MGRLKTYGWDIFETDAMISDRWRSFFGSGSAGSGRPAAVYAKVSNGRGLSFAVDDAPKIKMSMETMERALEELEGKTNGWTETRSCTWDVFCEHLASYAEDEDFILVVQD
jgi:hypothetical protein